MLKNCNTNRKNSDVKCVAYVSGQIWPRGCNVYGYTVFRSKHLSLKKTKTSAVETQWSRATERNGIVPNRSGRSSGPTPAKELRKNSTMGGGSTKTVAPVKATQGNREKSRPRKREWCNERTQSRFSRLPPPVHVHDCKNDDRGRRLELEQLPMENGRERNNH